MERLCVAIIMQGALKIVQPLPCSIKKNRTNSSFSDLSLEEEAELGRVFAIQQKMNELLL